MYLAVDIGGTKTKIAKLSADGKTLSSSQFKTDKDYQIFINHLSSSAKKLGLGDVKMCCTAVPGLLDRRNGVVVALGNLPWRNQPIRADISKALNNIKTIIEHDTSLGTLAAAQELKQPGSILYVTISTGIGGGLVHDGKIVKALQDCEIGKMPLVYQGKTQHWEEFAGGRAIIAAYGKRAEDIDEAKTWDEIAGRIAYGLGAVVSAINPDTIVFGGGVGQFANKFIPQTASYLKQQLHPNVKQPKLLVASRPLDVVLDGCYLMARQAE